MTRIIVRRAVAQGGLLAALLSAAMAGPALAKPPAPAPAGIAPASAAPAPAATPAPAPAATPVPAATFQSLAATVASVLPTTGSSTDTSACADPAVTQPFLGWGDTSWYALSPGESPDNFAAGGWTLSGGASVITTQLQDGQTGSVLDLPSGAIAISPPMCVDSDYPTARSMMQTTGGAQIGAGVFYAGQTPKNQLQLAGIMQSTGTGFSPSQPLQVNPGNRNGWQMVQFIFGTTGSGGDGQLYNFYVDPRMSR